MLKIKRKLLGSGKVENILLEALKTSSIDFNIDSDEKYQYELIANGEEKNCYKNLENTLRIVTNL